MTSKYDALGDHLARLGAPVITLTFAEIEAVIGPLPETARYQSEWWGATPSSRYKSPHAYRWWQAGYVADRPDFAAATVTFRRVAKTSDVASQ